MPPTPNSVFKILGRERATAFDHLKEKDMAKKDAISRRSHFHHETERPADKNFSLFVSEAHEIFREFPWNLKKKPILYSVKVEQSSVNK